MFILRNIGNFVPKYNDDNDFHGRSAAIEYAVSVLEVEDIIVCGHDLSNKDLMKNLTITRRGTRLYCGFFEFLSVA